MTSLVVYLSPKGCVADMTGDEGFLVGSKRSDVAWLNFGTTTPLRYYKSSLWMSSGWLVEVDAYSLLSQVT